MGKSLPCIRIVRRKGWLVSRWWVGGCNERRLKIQAREVETDTKSDQRSQEVWTEDERRSVSGESEGVDMNTMVADWAWADVVAAATLKSGMWVEHWSLEDSTGQLPRGGFSGSRGEQSDLHLHHCSSSLRPLITPMLQHRPQWVSCGPL